MTQSILPRFDFILMPIQFAVIHLTENKDEDKPFQCNSSVMFDERKY